MEMLIHSWLNDIYSGKLINYKVTVLFHYTTAFDATVDKKEKKDTHLPNLYTKKNTQIEFTMT